MAWNVTVVARPLSSREITPSVSYELYLFNLFGCLLSDRDSCATFEGQ